MIQNKINGKIIYPSSCNDNFKHETIIEKRCIICYNQNSLRSLTEDSTYLGNTVNYLVMLDKCFGIKFKVKNGDTVDAICLLCVGRLRQTLEFRKDIDLAHQRFALYLKKGRKALVRTLSNTPQTENTKSPRLSLLSSARKELFSRRRKRFEVRITTNNSTGHESFDSYNTQIEIENKISKNYESDWSVTSSEIDRATSVKKTNIKDSYTFPDFDKNSNQCPICFVKINDTNALFYHYSKHTPHSVCYICGYRSVRTNIDDHYETHNATRFPCTICDRTFNQKNSRNHHIRVYHKNKKYNKCRICKESFGSMWSKRKHMIQEHRKNFKVEQCTLCERTFFTIFKLKEHIDSVHHQKKNVFCDVCGHGFYKNSTLKRHMLVHTGPSEHECEYCGKCFRRKNSLTVHIKRHLRNQ